MPRTLVIRPERPLETAGEIIAALEGLTISTDQVRLVTTLGGKVREIKVYHDR